ncbi:hypothetical protein [Streptomyces sp. NPDC006309]
MHQPPEQWRGPATRIAELTIAYRAALHLVGILLWTRHSGLEVVPHGV